MNGSSRASVYRGHYGETVAIHTGSLAEAVTVPAAAVIDIDGVNQPPQCPWPQVLEGFMRFALVVRFPPGARDDAEAIGNLLVSAPGGQKVPLKELARIESETGPAEVSRENGRRRISVEVNVRDIGSFVAEARARVEQEVNVEPGYLVDWSGMYEHLESGRNRLLLVVPLAFLLIFLLLFATFHSLRQAALVFTGIPFAATGGVLSLYLGGMPFSMSAGIGFIALFGVAVLNGVVMVTFINSFARGASAWNKR